MWAHECRFEMYKSSIHKYVVPRELTSMRILTNTLLQRSTTNTPSHFKKTPPSAGRKNQTIFSNLAQLPATYVKNYEGWGLAVSSTYPIAFCFPWLEPFTLQFREPLTPNTTNNTNRWPIHVSNILHHQGWLKPYK